MKNKNASIFLLLIVVLFAAFVWPTKWRYDKMRSDRDYIVRINRVTGTAQILGSEGWETLGGK